MAKDLTKGSEWKVILLFTLPLMAGNLLQQIYSLTDGLVAGNLAGQDALSAVGIVFPVTFLLLAVATGMTNGCGVIVAQYFGAGDIPNLRKAVSTGILTILGASVVITAAGFLLTRPLLVYVLNTPDHILPLAMTYMQIYCAGLVFQFGYNVFAAILRALGDSRSTLYFLLVAAILNVVLDIVMAGPFGIAGVAWATVIAQAGACICSAVYLFKKVDFLRYKKGEFSFRPEMFRLALRLGIPSTIQQCCVGLGMMLMQRLINSFGDAAISATTAAMRVESFAMVPIMMFFQGLANFTGQNMGAGRVDRVRRGYRQTLVMSECICIFIICVILLFSNFIIGCFGLNDEGLVFGSTYLRTVSVFFCVFCLMYVTNGILQGSGDVMFPTIASLVSLSIRVIAANLLAAFTPLGYTSILVAIPLGWFCGSAIVVGRFLSGRWANKSLIRSQNNKKSPD